MPPSATQVTENGILSWADYVNNSKRSQLTFLDDHSVRWSGENENTPVRISGVALPEAAQDVTNKAYVDAAIQGLTFKAPVRLATLIPKVLAALVPGAVFESSNSVDIALNAGDRILLMSQGNAGDNGIWQIEVSGPPTRPLDFGGGANPTNASGTYVFVDQGALMDRAYVCITDRTNAVVGASTNLEWVQFSARQSAMAGFGLSVGTAMELDVDGTVIPWLAAADNTFTGTIHAPKVTGLLTSEISHPTDAVNLDTIVTRHNAAPYKEPVSVVVSWNVGAPPVALAANAVFGGQPPLVVGARVLLVGQTNKAENGIWVVTSAAAERAADMALNTIVPSGTLIPVASGEVFVTARVCTVGSPVNGLTGLVQHGTTWRGPVRSVLDVAVPDPTLFLVGASNGTLVLPNGETIAVGDRVLLRNQSNPLWNDVWVVASFGQVAAPAPEAAQTRTGDVVVDAQRRMFVCTDGDVHIWMPLQERHEASVRRAVSTQVTNPSATLVAGFLGLDSGDRVLLLGQSDGTECGIWVVAPVDGAAMRSIDMATGSTLAPGTQVTDSSGNVYVYRGSAAVLGTNDAAAWAVLSSKFIAPVRAVVDHPLPNAAAALVCDANGTLSLPALPGLALHPGDRVLLTQQSSAAERVVWVVAEHGGQASATHDLEATDRNGAVVVDVTGRMLACEAPDAQTVVWHDHTASRSLVKTPVAAATTNDIGDPALTLVVPLQLDGVALTAGQRVLLKDQTDPTQNGIWVVGSATLVPSRAADLPHLASPLGACVTVLAGARYRMTTWMPQGCPATARVGIDALSWAFVRSESEEFHRPVRAATVADVDLATGLHVGASVDGVVLRSGDRVLLKDQNDASQNGIWLAGTPTIRAADFATNAPGTGAHLWVAEGHINGQSVWVCTTPAATVGSTELTFRCLQAERTYYKEAVIAATVHPLTSLTTDLLPGGQLDGVPLVDGMRVLVKDQADATENGIYVVGNPPWRSMDMRAGTHPGGVTVPVLTGSVNQNTMWVCGADSSAIVGLTALIFRSPVVDATNGGVYKEAVHAASTANIPSLGTSLKAGFSLDGASLPAGVRVLIKDQTDARENGIYVVLAGGAERAADMALNAACTGAAMMVMTGATWGGQILVCMNLSGQDVVGTHGLMFQSIQKTSSQNTFTGVITAPRVTGLLTDAITEGSDAVNVEYLVDRKNASVYKEAVAVVVNEPVPNPAATLVATVQNGQTLLSIGGAELRPGDRVLLTGQAGTAGTTVTENGIWTVGSPGGSATRGDDYQPTAADPQSEVALVVQSRAGSEQVSGAYVGSQKYWHRVQTEANTVYKQPARVATTHALDAPATSLVPGVVVDGRVVAAGDRVLVKNQAVSAENGVWVVRSPTAVRASDLRAGYDWTGCSVEVVDGLTQSQTRWTCAGPSGAWTASEPWPVAWKAAVCAAANTNIPIASLLVGSTADGYALSSGDRVLLMAQSNAQENGVWVVGDMNRPPMRSADLPDAAHAAGCCLYATYGTANARQAFVCVNGATADVVGIAALQFVPLLNHDIAPWLAKPNTFTASNAFNGSTTFAGTVAVTNATAATSQTTGAVVVAGGMGIGGNVYCNSSYNMSDERLKTDFVPLEERALEVVAGLRGYEFTWQSDPTCNYTPLNAAAGRTGRSVGVKAQELQAAGAGLCVARDEQGILSVDYCKIVPYLIDAVRVLKRRVDTLEQRRTKRRRS